MPTLQWFRDEGAVSATRYAALHLWHQGAGIWRLLLTDDTNDTDVTGPPYRTKAEALSALESVAEMTGGAG